MNTSYIYSVSRTNTLGADLLTQTDIERLLVAESGAPLQTALKETYLASYVLQVPGEDVALAIEDTLIQAKKLIHRIAPQGDIFRVLWVQYDLHNLRVFAKAAAGSTPKSFDQVQAYLSARGIYDPAYLYEHAEAGTLSSLQPGWQAAYDRAVAHATAGTLDQLDAVFDELFFATIVRMSQLFGDAFITQHVASSIDLYNLKSQLRALRLGDKRTAATFVPGGTLPAEGMQTVEDIATAFDRLSPGMFAAALQTVADTGNTTELDARVDDYLVTLAKTAATDVFSSASLVLYYLRVRQAAANIRTIVVGRNSGQSLDTIRTNLRTAYVNA